MQVVADVAQRRDGTALQDLFDDVPSFESSWMCRLASPFHRGRIGVGVQQAVLLGALDGLPELLLEGG
eukprot:2863653-Pyramimonas_sp.AAC.1